MFCSPESTISAQKPKNPKKRGRGHDDDIRVKIENIERTLTL
jgi:hypothetical protein